MRRWQKIAIGIIMIVPAMFGTWKLSRSRTCQLFGEIVARVETERKVVALTFDDGPAPGFPERVLGVLREHGVTATFFVVGNALKAHPELGRLGCGTGVISRDSGRFGVDRPACAGADGAGIDYPSACDVSEPCSISSLGGIILVHMGIGREKMRRLRRVGRQTLQR